MRLQTTQPGLLPKKPPETVPDAWPDSLERQTRFQQVLHQKHWTDRHRIIASLNQDPTERLHPLARRLNSCGNGASLFLDPEHGKPRAWISRCGSKLCPFCANARTAHTSEDLLPLILEHGCTRIMVLTMRSNDLPLADQIISILAALKRLRHRKLWRDKITGGVRVIEITMNAKTARWHPHLHILFRGDFILQRLVARAWKEITRDSNIVRLNMVRNADGMVAEFTKYLGKPQRIASLTPYQIREYAKATKGVRMIQTFGDCHNHGPKDTDKPDSKPHTDRRVGLATLIHLARSGFDTPARLLELVAQRWAIFSFYIWHELPQLDPTSDDERKRAALLRRQGTPRAPPVIKPEYPTEPEVLDAEIAAQLFLYFARRDEGRYRDVRTYYQTRTEDLNGNFHRSLLS